MSARRKRRNGKRSVPARAPRVSPRRLLEQAREALAGGDGRRALDLLRQARDRDLNLPALPLLSFCACMRRARQLAAKGMDREAAAMRARAEGYRASIAEQALTEDDWVWYVRYLDAADALAACAHGQPGPRAERVLADRLVIERCWEGLEVLDESHPLRRDAVAVAAGLDAMDAGDWARAAALLDVPRRSPFAAWRLFCRAMACFGAGDDDGLRRILDRLPADFALARTVAECRRLIAVDGGGDGSAGAPSPLGGGRGKAEALAGELKRAFRKKNVRAMGPAMERLADALYPDDPVLARIDLLEIASMAASRGVFPAPALIGLAHRLLPADRAVGVLARVLLLGQQVALPLWNPSPAAALLDRLPVEFPRTEDQALARACVFETLARAGRDAVHPELLPPERQAAVAELLGRPLDDVGMVFVELMTASLAADPDNRDGYLFLLDLLRGHPGAKPRLQRVLQDMADRFPDDPMPWLELATVHYSRNAYRQAESALAEARRRAPHDDRLLDLQAVGFLKSADESRNKGRFALAARDLERAEDLGRRVIGQVLPAKRLMLEIVSGGRSAGAKVARRLKGLPPGAQLRTLVLLIRDLYDNSHIGNVGPHMATAVRGMLADKAVLFDECSPEEIAGLFEPLPAEHDILYRDRRLALIFVDRWPALLERLDGERLAAVLDVLLDCGGFEEVRAEIEHRLHGVGRAGRDPVLLFHLAVIRYEDGSDHDFRRFVDVLNRVDAATRERLRAVAARLARHTRGPLRQALLTFDFKPLDGPPAEAGEELPGLSEILSLLDQHLGIEDRPDEPDGPAPPLGLTDSALGEQFHGTSFDWNPSEEIVGLEDMIDDSGLRGESPAALKEVAGNMRAEPTLRRKLDRVARACEASGLGDRLSPELRVLLFPRAGRKGRR